LCVIKKPRERGGHSPRWAKSQRNWQIIILLYIVILDQIS
jgi:hypothetical protein